MSRITTRLAAGVVAAVFAAAGWANAQSTYFNKASGDWTSAGNWSGGAVPGPGFDARIGSDAASAATPAVAYIHGGEVATSSILRVGYPVTSKGVGTLVVEGGALAVTNSFNIGYVGGGTGTVIQSGGVVDGTGPTGPAALNIGSGTTGKGTYSLGGSATVLTNFYLNGLNNGEVYVTNGASAYITAGGANWYLGSAGASILLSVDQAYASLKHTGYAYCGGNPGTLANLSVTRGGVLDLGIAGGFYVPAASATGIVTVSGGGLLRSSAAMTIGAGSGGAGYGWLYISGASTAQLASITFGSSVGGWGYGYITNSTILLTGAGNALVLGSAAGATGEIRLANSYLGVTNNVRIGDGGAGRIWLSNSTFEVRGATTTYLPNNGVGELYASDGATVLLVPGATLANGASGRGTVSITGATLRSVGAFTVGSGGFGALYLQGGATGTLGSVSIGYNGGSSGLLSVADSSLAFDAMTVANAGTTGTVFVTNSTVVCRRIDVGNGVAGAAMLMAGDSTLLFTNTASKFIFGQANGAPGTGILTNTRIIITNVASNVDSLYVGNGGTGVLVMTDCTLLNSGQAPFASVSGARGNLQMTRSYWCQGGYIQMSGVANSTSTVSLVDSVVTNMNFLYMTRYTSSTRADISLARSTWWNGNYAYVGGAGVGMLTVSNSTFDGAGGIRVGNGVNTLGMVELLGTQRLLRASTLEVGYSSGTGTVTNRIWKFAGGIDITNSASASLTIGAGSKVHLAFEQNPAAKGDFWGLRWVGNHTNDLAVFTNASPKKLTWDDSALDPFYQGQVKIYTNATHTFVGFVVTRTLGGAGSVFMIR